MTIEKQDSNRAMRIYISGKIGEPAIGEAAKEKFAHAKTNLEEEGFEVFDPTNEEWQKHLLQGYGRDVQQALVPPGGPIKKYDYFLLRNLMALATKDAIYMLKDWVDSPGARAEHAFARAIGLEVMYEEESVDMSIRDVVERMIDDAEEVNAGKVFVKIQRVLKRDWDMILTVVRHKENK